MKTIKSEEQDLEPPWPTQPIDQCPMAQPRRCQGCNPWRTWAHTWLWRFWMAQVFGFGGTLEHAALRHGSRVACFIFRSGALCQMTFVKKCLVERKIRISVLHSLRDKNPLLHSCSFTKRVCWSLTPSPGCLDVFKSFFMSLTRLWRPPTTKPTCQRKSDQEA